MADPTRSDDLATHFVEYAPGQDIFRDGDPGGDLFVIQEGRVAILKGAGGAERELALLGPGDFFGEMSILAGLPRTATARAEGACRLLRIDDDLFDAVLAERPEIAARMLRDVALRVREFYEAHAVASRSSGEVPVATGALVHLATGTRLALSPGPESSVGRVDPMTGRVPYVDLTALDTANSVSRFHAKLVRRGRRIVIRDEGPSTNGTFVNGERIGPAEERELVEGDEVRFGGVFTRFVV